MTNKEIAIDFIKENVKDMIFLGNYKSFDVFKISLIIPYEGATGLPTYVLVKDGKARLTRGYEGLEISVTLDSANIP